MAAYAGDNVKGGLLADAKADVGLQVVVSKDGSVPLKIKPMPPLAIHARGIALSEPGSLVEGNTGPPSDKVDDNPVPTNDRVREYKVALHRCPGQLPSWCQPW